MLLRALVALVVVTPAWLESQVMPSSDGLPEVSATARGEIRQLAERAWISFSIETRNKSAAGAASANSQISSVVLAALKNAGVAASDITSAGYSVHTDFDRGESRPTPRPAGFIARNSMRVEVRKMDDVGRIIDVGLNAGATQVTTAQLGPADTNAARRQALAIAVEEARRDAEVMARAAGGSLGALISITNSTSAANINFRGNGMNEMVQVAASAIGPTPISPREITIFAIASGRWQFIPSSR